MACSCLPTQKSPHNHLLSSAFVVRSSRSSLTESLRSENDPTHSMASSCTLGSQKSLQTSPPAYNTTGFYPAGHSRQRCSRKPVQPPDCASTSEALTIYGISALRGGDFGYSAQGIKDQYVALSCLHVGKTTLRAVMDRLGRPSESLYDQRARSTDKELGGKPTLRCGKSLSTLLFSPFQLTFVS